MPERDAPEKEQAPGLPRLPPGRHGLDRDFVAQNQRDRLTAGIIAAVAEGGYHDTTVTQICAAAGVSRRTFYSYFSSKEECYLRAFDLVAEHLSSAMGEAGEVGDEWPVVVRERIVAMLSIFAANPDLVRFALVAPLRAGEEIAAYYRQGVERILENLGEGRPREGTRQPAPAIEQALIGGMIALIAHKVEAGEGEALPSLEPDLVELFLSPYVGREIAVKAAGSSPGPIR